MRYVMETLPLQWVLWDMWGASCAVERVGCWIWCCRICRAPVPCCALTGSPTQTFKQKHLGKGWAQRRKPPPAAGRAPYPCFSALSHALGCASRPLGTHRRAQLVGGSPCPEPFPPAPQGADTACPTLSTPGGAGRSLSPPSTPTWQLGHPPAPRTPSRRGPGAVGRRQRACRRAAARPGPAA